MSYEFPNEVKPPGHPELLLPCECGDLCHVTGISRWDDDDGSYHVELFVQSRSILERLKFAWRILRGQRQYVNDVVWSLESCGRLIEFFTHGGYEAK